MKRILAVALVVLGVAALVLGRLGETVWAPAEERTATVTLQDPGPAVVLDPGVLYVGGREGTLRVTGASEVSVITATPSDVEQYLEGTRHTRITGVPAWGELSTETVGEDGATEIPDPTSSDLWRSVHTGTPEATVQIEDVWAGESGADEQPYRALLLVTDGAQPGARTVTLTWPVEAEHGWVPYAYAGGAALAVIGLVLLVVAPGRRRAESAPRPEEER